VRLDGAQDKLEMAFEKVKRDWGSPDNKNMETAS